MLRAVLLALLAVPCLAKLIRAYSASRVRRRLEDLYQRQKLKEPILKRETIINSLKGEDFDVLIIGGGCVGAGCALDAASRGLRVGLVEALDFGSETSSKSTKLLHGGIRYLQKVLGCFGLSQLLLVLNALHERKTVMRMAPYLTRTVRIMAPIYSIVKVPFYFVLLKLYDWLSWGRSLGRSYLLSEKATSLYFSNLKRQDLKSAMIYHDGMMFDARINVMLVKTAAFYGATTANHTKFLEFVKNEKGQISGVRVSDEIGGDVFAVRARVVISSAGPFTDGIRRKNNHAENIMVPSIGTHIVIEPGFGTEDMGILDTATSDNRVVFILPWNNHTIVGSTEVECQTQPQIKPSEDEVHFLLSEINKYTDKKIPKRSITSAWAGIRPLVKAGIKGSTEGIVRKFKILDDGNGLVMVAGGKWTTFRTMAERTIDLAVKKYRLEPASGCLTSQIQILGSRKYSRDLFYEISRALEIDIGYSKHLLSMYGDQAFKLRKYIKKYPARLSNKYLFTEGEAIYCLESEMAMNAPDIVNNRFGVGYYDVEEAHQMVQKVDALLVRYFGKKGIRYEPDQEYAAAALESLGYELVSRFREEN